MKNQWLIWVVVIGVVALVLFVFNYQTRKEAVPLSEIFPEGKTPALEYEFVREESAEEEAAPALPQTAKEPAPAPVTQPVVPPAVSPAVTAPAVGEADFSRVPYTIQILSSRDRAQAEAALKKAKAAGHQAYLVTKDLGAKGIWHRIYVGKFQGKPEADRALEGLRKEYKECFVITPR